MIDFIGDIHGYADELEALLQKLGYVKVEKGYSHKDRKVLFVGGYIDRGPKIRETLEIVKTMCDNGEALALLGNHEYNALCFFMKDAEGNHLRKHSPKNVDQISETIKQFEGREEEWKNYLEWFKTLPLYLETANFRAVHACWDDKSIKYLRNVLPNDKLTDERIVESAVKGSPLFEAIDIVLKGKELPLPGGLTFLDKGGEARAHYRIRWWENPANLSPYELSIHPIAGLKDLGQAPVILDDGDYYLADEKPVFFGHYWLDGERPELFRNNICCLDYSVANDGKLAAYRYNGEDELQEEGFVWV